MSAEPECVFVFPHAPHTLYKNGGAGVPCTGREPLREATVIEEIIDHDPYDALQLAVQLHSERYQYQDVASETVLRTADAFLAWLRANKKGDAQPSDERP